MTKKEIVKVISERAGLTQLKTKEIVQWTFDAIIDTLIEEGRIELRNFGVFEVKRRRPRKARNPRTGAKVEVAEKNVVTFQPGKEMEERVRQMPMPERPSKTRKSRAPSAPSHPSVNNGTNVDFRSDGAHSRNLEPALSGAPGGD